MALEVTIEVDDDVEKEFQEIMVQAGKHGIDVDSIQQLLGASLSLFKWYVAKKEQGQEVYFINSTTGEKEKADFFYKGNRPPAASN